jgi:hypothetical protein
MEERGPSRTAITTATLRAADCLLAESGSCGTRKNVAPEGNQNELRELEHENDHTPAATDQPT